jgi:hypothetical protein
MQLDMHFYGTYAMARAAGIKPEFAEVIATAAQYVDDSDTANIELRDGRFVACAATAHHPVDAKNIDPYDQRQVWIPFHFLPGNQGSTFDERLICRMDSPLAHEVIDNALQHAMEPYGLMLIGIVAHTYADTFSHYGFSGIASSVNGVDIDSITPRIQSSEVLRYVLGKAGEYFEKRKADAANLLKLGHGSVATYPDRPYLRWDFRYLDGRYSGDRDNPTTFLLACEKLHAMFSRFAEVAPIYADTDAIAPFQKISSAVTDILVIEGALEARIDAWHEAANKGQLFVRPEKIPTYREGSFANDLAKLGNYSSQEVRDKQIFNFLKAAKAHRDFVLNDLLPRNGMDILLP